MPDPFLQDRIGWQPDGVANVLGLDQLIDLGVGERRVAAECLPSGPMRQAALVEQRRISGSS
jgi:hypothetical protein